MAVTPIKARCRRCGEDFHLYELLDHRDGTCPQCGWILTPVWTTKLLEDAAVADIAQRHLVGSLRNLRDLPGNMQLRPHTVLRNLFEEVGWHNDLADDPEMLRHELHELQRLLGAWQLLEPHVAATQPAEPGSSGRSTGCGVDPTSWRRAQTRPNGGMTTSS
jgi:hypothetical protein